jgi:hypothetical protein
VGRVARMGEMRNAYKIIVGKPKWRRPFERSMPRPENNIKIYLRHTGWEHVAKDSHFTIRYNPVTHFQWNY